MRRSDLVSGPSYELDSVYAGHKQQNGKGKGRAPPLPVSSARYRV